MIGGRQAWQPQGIFLVQDLTWLHCLGMEHGGSFLFVPFARGIETRLCWLLRFPLSFRKQTNRLHPLSHPLGEMVRQARVLAQATSDLVNAMRSDAEAEIDMENSKKLLAAAKLLADSTARMVEAAKVVHWIYSIEK